MGKVVAFKPDVIEEVHKIAQRWAEADRTVEKGQSIRVEVGMRLLVLRERVEAGEAGDYEWWPWVRAKIINRTKRDMEKCMALARSEDPEAAAEHERARDWYYKKASKNKAASALTQPRVVSYAQREDRDIVFRALDLLERMNKTERKRFFAKLKEGYGDEISQA